MLFGDTVSLYNEFWHSGFEGRLTLPELFGLETGWVVVLVVCMAIVMFWGFGKVRTLIYGKDHAGP